MLASGQFVWHTVFMSIKAPLQIACQQVLLEDNSVFSIQWTDLPPELATGMTPQRLLEAYLDSHQADDLG